MADRKDAERLLGLIAQMLEEKITEGEATAAELTVALNLCKSQNIMLPGAAAASLGDILADVDEDDLPEAYHEYKN